MFDIGWTELMVIACVAIIVVGPKDLPRMLRTLGQTVGKMRRLSREFQSTFNDALREAEKQADIADMKKQVEEAANFDPLGDVKKSIQDEVSSRKSEEPKPAAPIGAAPATSEEAGSVSAPAPVAKKDPAAPAAKKKAAPAAGKKPAAATTRKAAAAPAKTEPKKPSAAAAKKPAAAKTAKKDSAASAAKKASLADKPATEDAKA